MSDLDRARIDSVCNGFADIQGMRSVAITRGGELLTEHYFNGAAHYLLHDVRSVTKSVLSMLVGIAIGEGDIPSVEAPIGAWLRPLVDDLDDRIAGTRLEDLLTMRAGHPWQVSPEADEFSDWIGSIDPLLYILDKPVVEAPGTRFNYSDGSAHLVSVVLTEATGMTALRYAEQKLFEPLGILNRQAWFTDYRGYNLGGVGLAVRTRELLALGNLYLDGGRYQGKQLVPADWVERSTAIHATGVPEGKFRNAVLGGGYGYFWWPGRAGGESIYLAQGVGGQWILNVPARQLCIVTTCKHWGEIPRETVWANGLAVIGRVVDELLPALGVS